MNRKAVLAIWKKVLLVWILPWILYTTLLCLDVIPIWTGLFLPFVLTVVYSRYTHSSFSVPKYLAFALYLLSVYVGLLGALYRLGIGALSVPVPIAIGIVVVIILSIRGVRSWLTVMGTTERALGGTTYVFSFLYGLWVYWSLSYKIISLNLFMWVLIGYFVYHFAIYVGQISGKLFRLQLEKMNYGPGRYLGTIGNPLTFNLNLLMASTLGTLAIYYLTHLSLLAWLVSLVSVLGVLYNTKRSVVVGAAVYFLILPIVFVWDLRLSYWLILIYYVILFALGYYFFRGSWNISRRLRSTLWALIYSLKLRKKDIHPQIKYFILSTSTTRLWLALSGIKTWLKSPLWGFGFEYVRRYIMEHRAIETYYAEHTRGYDRSHNMYVDILIEGGVIWLAVLIYLSIPIFKALMSYPASMVLMITTLVVLFFLFWDIVFLSALSYLIGWAYFAIPVYTWSVPTLALQVVVATLSFVVLLAIIRHVSDMYKGLSRSIVPNNLEQAREVADVAIAICPYQDHSIVWRTEVAVKLIQVLDAGNASPAYAARLAESITQYENHIRITNYPDTFLAYLGYAYGTLYRLWCKDCLEKALYFFEQALALNPFNEATISTYANFAGNIRDWDRACKILEGIIHAKYTNDPMTFEEQMKEAFFEAVKDHFLFVNKKPLNEEEFDINAHTKGRVGWQPGRIAPNLMKMYIFCLVEQKRFDEAKQWLKFYEDVYKDADPAYIDEMFLKIKLGQLRNI